MNWGGHKVHFSFLCILQFYSNVQEISCSLGGRSNRIFLSLKRSLKARNTLSIAFWEINETQPFLEQIKCLASLFRYCSRFRLSELPATGSSDSETRMLFSRSIRSEMLFREINSSFANNKQTMKAWKSSSLYFFNRSA